MKIILTEDVSTLGKMGDIVEVKEGYARNFLIPQKAAVAATPRNVKAQQHTLAGIEKKKAKAVSSAQELASRLAGVSLTFTRKAGEGGRLFGSVTNMDVAEGLAEKGFTIDRKQIHLTEPIKETGDFEVTIRLFHEVTTPIRVRVEREPGEETAEPAAAAPEAGKTAE